VPNLVSRTATSLWQRRHPEFGRDPTGPGFDLGWADLPRYATDRARIALDRRRHGDDRPWLTAGAVEALSSLLRPGDRGLEFGSGGSTAWLAERTAHLTSIEASAHWHAEVERRIAARGLRNVTMHLVSADRMGAGTADHRRAYVGACPELAPGSLDYVLVDACYRDEEALRAIDLLRGGGLLIVDNANTYLPSPGRAPWRVTRPATAAWADFAERVRDWRRLWTTNGSWDTVIWFKPAAS